MTVDDPRPDDALTTPSITEAAQRLSKGLYQLAIEAGQLEKRVVGHSPDELDHDTHLALDQAQNNAAAIAATLDRLGLG